MLTKKKRWSVNFVILIQLYGISVQAIPVSWTVSSAPAPHILFTHHWMPALHWPAHCLLPSYLQPWKSPFQPFFYLTAWLSSLSGNSEKGHVFPLFQEYAQLISSTKDQLNKAVPAPLRPERQVLPTEKSSGPPLLNRIVNISQLTRLLLTMAQDFRRSWL